MPTVLAFGVKKRCVPPTTQCAHPKKRHDLHTAIAQRSEEKIASRQRTTHLLLRIKCVTRATRVRARSGSRRAVGPRGQRRASHQPRAEKLSDVVDRASGPVPVLGGVVPRHPEETVSVGAGFGSRDTPKKRCVGPCRRLRNPKKRCVPPWAQLS